MVTMSLEGTDVFQELQAALGRAKGVLADCQGETDRLDGQMHDLLARRGEALLELARHYLPEISRPVIESTFEGIRGDLFAILAQREARRKELQARLAEGNEEIRRRDAEIDDVTDRLNEKVVLREQLEAKVAEILKGNADFQERSRLALQAEERLHRDEKRVEDMAKEAAEKLPHYDGSRLFRYLYDRGYGTPDYHSKGLVLNLDRWVARLIDYPNARNGYEFLKKTPELVASEVSRRRDQFTELMQQVEAIEKEEADKVGLTAVLAEGDALGTERDRLVQELERLQKQAQDLQAELAGWTRPRTDSTTRRSSGSGRSSARPRSPSSRTGRGRPPSPRTTRSSPSWPGSTARSRASPPSWPRSPTAGTRPTGCRRGSTASSAGIAGRTTTPTGRTSKTSTSAGCRPASRAAPSGPTTSGGRSRPPSDSGPTGSSRASRTARRSSPARPAASSSGRSSRSPGRPCETPPTGASNAGPTSRSHVPDLPLARGGLPGVVLARALEFGLRGRVHERRWILVQEYLII